MIDTETNLLPVNLAKKVRFLGTTRCNGNSCISVGVGIERHDLILADQDGNTFKIPADERLGVLMLIAQSVQP